MNATTAVGGNARPDNSRMALAAARAGKHVFVEKPMALTLAGADRAIAAAAEAGVDLLETLIVNVRLTMSERQPMVDA